MAKKAARDVNISINSVALEDDIDTAALNVTQETPVVTAFADAGPRRLSANYDYEASGSGSADFAASQSDATLFGLVGSAGVAVSHDPTGATAGANDPNYDSTSMVLASYALNFATGQAAKFSYSLQGNSALARAVA